MLCQQGHAANSWCVGVNDDLFIGAMVLHGRKRAFGERSACDRLEDERSLFGRNGSVVARKRIVYSGNGVNLDSPACLGLVADFLLSLVLFRIVGASRYVVFKNLK